MWVNLNTEALLNTPLAPASLPVTLHGSSSQVSSVCHPSDFPLKMCLSSSSIHTLTHLIHHLPILDLNGTPLKLLYLSDTLWQPNWDLILTIPLWLPLSLEPALVNKPPPSAYLSSVTWKLSMQGLRQRPMSSNKRPNVSTWWTLVMHDVQLCKSGYKYTSAFWTLTGNTGSMALEITINRRRKFRVLG